MWQAHVASNMNFPAPLAVLGFLAACGGLFLALASSVISWFVRKPKIACGMLLLGAVGAILYLGLLSGFSLASHATTVPRGQEKYFCEIDCHLAYSVVGVQTQALSTALRYRITLRTRFDETTTSPSRPIDAPLNPSPRIIRLIDASGNEYVPVTVQGTPLLTHLKPADSYTTQLEFRVPKETAPGEATSLRLLLQTAPGWPDHFVIGDENSWLHKKTYFAL
jgi:hypothetical protein